MVGELGPGLVTGASRNDPSSITTFARVGAATGYGLLWTLVFSYPLLAGIQDISARAGRVTGVGLAGTLRRHYPRWLLYTAVSLLLIANTINLGADIGAMGYAVKMLIGGPALLHAAVLAAASVTLQVMLSYTRYASILKWLALALVAYFVTAFVVRVDWPQALRGLFVPSMSLAAARPTAVLASLGATINPYLFFWQASQEVEEQDETPGEEPLSVAPEQAARQIHRIKLDTYTGMAYANVVAIFVMLTTAAVLHERGDTSLTSLAHAAEALRPAAGPFAYLLFGLGIIGTGLLAIPVLAGSAAYAVGEALGWPVSLGCRPTEARGFYAILVVATLVGLALVSININPVVALYWAAVVNGALAAPMMVMLMMMTTNPTAMGGHTLSVRLRVMGWAATAAMLAAALGLAAR